MITVKIPLGSGTALDGDLYRAEGDEGDKRIAILCHGFTAYRRYMFLPFVGKLLASRGLTTLLIDFSRNGISCETGEFDDLESFSRNTFENGRQELVGCIRAIVEEDALGSEVSRVYLMGHSHGGVGVLGAASDLAVVTYVKKVSAWSTPSDLLPARFGATPEQLAFWKANGEIPYPVERLGIEVPLKLEVLHDMESDPFRVEKFVRGIECPLQVVHGEADTRIPLECGERIANWAKNGEIQVIRGADHVFNVKLPESEPTSEVIEAGEALVRFFLK